MTHQVRIHRLARLDLRDAYEWPHARAGVRNMWRLHCEIRLRQRTIAITVRRGLTSISGNGSHRNSGVWHGYAARRLLQGIFRIGMFGKSLRVFPIEYVKLNMLQRFALSRLFV